MTTTRSAGALAIGATVLCGASLTLGLHGQLTAADARARAEAWQMEAAAWQEVALEAGAAVPEPSAVLAPAPTTRAS